jgi:hypothetical protein
LRVTSCRSPVGPAYRKVSMQPSARARARSKDARDGGASGRGVDEQATTRSGSKRVMRPPGHGDWVAVATSGGRGAKRGEIDGVLE